MCIKFLTILAIFILFFDRRFLILSLISSVTYAFGIIFLSKEQYLHLSSWLSEQEEFKYFATIW